MDEKRKDMLTVVDVCSIMEEIAPVSLQESWDNSGLMIGFSDTPVTRILTCLEMDSDVADEAAAIGAELVVTHHPLIFNGVKSLRDDDPEGQVMMKLIRDGISVYSCHTPFDKVKGGNSDAIAEMIGLSSVKNLKGDTVTASPAKMAEKAEEADIGRLGKLKTPVSCREILGLISDQMGISMRQLRFVGDVDREITVVGICAGAGADLMDMAAAAGCELFITGDVKHHEARNAQAHGICLVDAGHYGTERSFAENMKEKLEKKTEGRVEISASRINQDPFTVF